MTDAEIDRCFGVSETYHTCTHTYTHKHTRTIHIHENTHTQTHTYARARARAHAHTHTHTHTPQPPPQPLPPTHTHTHTHSHTGTMMHSVAAIARSYWGKILPPFALLQAFRKYNSRVQRIYSSVCDNKDIISSGIRAVSTYPPCTGKNRPNFLGYRSKLCPSDTGIVGDSRNIFPGAKVCMVSTPSSPRKIKV